MLRAGVDLFDDFIQEMSRPRHNHYNRQRIIPAGSSLLFLFRKTTCTETLIFVCSYRLRDDWPWVYQEHSPHAQQGLWWRPWKHTRISWQPDRIQFAESFQCGWCIRKKLCGHQIRHWRRFGGCLDLWRIQSLPENQANRLIFHAAMKRFSNQISIPDLPRQGFLDFNDIVKVWLGNALFMH